MLSSDSLNSLMLLLLLLLGALAVLELPTRPFKRAD